MRTVRKGVFETNSSSTHSVTIMSAEDYKRWQKEMLYYDEYKDVLLTKEELYNSVREEFPEYQNDKDVEDFIYDNRSEYAQTYKQFFNDHSLEVDVTDHTTKSGDEIVIICKYGYDS